MINCRQVHDKIKMPPLPVSDNVTWILTEQSFSVLSSINGNSGHPQKQSTIDPQTFNAWSTVVPRRWSTTNCWWQTCSRRRKSTFRTNSKSARSLHKWVAKQMKRFLLNQPDTLLVDELCEKVAWRHVLEQLYPQDNEETAFLEICSSPPDRWVSCLNDLSTSQEALRKQVKLFQKV